MGLFLRLLIIMLSLCVGLGARFLGEVSLKKDETKTFIVSLENIEKMLSFRWTLYKDSILVTHFKYDDIPHQFSLNRYYSNVAKITLSGVVSTNSPNPYMMFYFVDFNDSSKEAKFRYYVFDFSGDLEVI